jgi:hypothetical protein
VNHHQTYQQQQQGNHHQDVKINVQGIKYATLTQADVRYHVRASQVRVVTQKRVTVKLLIATMNAKALKDATQ